MPQQFVRPALLRLNGQTLTDHNRSELGVNIERIETRQRMANGTMRKYWVADKRTFTVSWADTPKLAAHTVDGFWSGEDLRAFHLTAASRGSMLLRVYAKTAQDFVEYSVVITDFSYTIKKRWEKWELWDFSLTMEEV